jgi:hypothetical protein
MAKIKFKEIEPVKETGKDWRDAFVEAGIITEDMKSNYGSAIEIEIILCTVCNQYGSLCQYVGQFENGGFQLSKNGGLHFVTKGVGSDEEATYEDAKAFLKARGDWK